MNVNENNDTVPYVLIPQNGNNRQFKAIFLVPEDLVDSLISRPILCRGSSFQLILDEDVTRENLRAMQNTNLTLQEGGIGSSTMLSLNTTRFLSTEFYSPEPNETAAEIALRLSIRMENSDNFVVETSNLLGKYLS